jgi:thiosulfate reductase cytochrome b subunit
MKIILRIISVIVLVSFGFAAGFPIGQKRGFTTGSEWAFVQASLIAREMGLFMPVNFVEGHFKIILKQPRGHFRRTRQLAEKYGAEIMFENKQEKTLAQNNGLIRSTYLKQ